MSIDSHDLKNFSFRKSVDSNIDIVYYTHSTVIQRNRRSVNMQYDSKVPIYLQVINMIKTDIINGRITCGQKLPSSRDLAVEYTINPNTAARVYQELEREGVCYTKRGMGTFVTEDEQIIIGLKKEMAEEAIDIFVKSIGELGISIDEAIELLRQKEE